MTPFELAAVYSQFVSVLNLLLLLHILQAGIARKYAWIVIWLIVQIIRGVNSAFLFWTAQSYTIWNFYSFYWGQMVCDLTAIAASMWLTNRLVEPYPRFAKKVRVGLSIWSILLLLATSYLLLGVEVKNILQKWNLFNQGVQIVYGGIILWFLALWAFLRLSSRNPDFLMLAGFLMPALVMMATTGLRILVSGPAYQYLTLLDLTGYVLGLVLWCRATFSMPTSLKAGTMAV